MLDFAFFNRDPQIVAKNLLGKILCHYYPLYRTWLKAMIIETEAYYLKDKASHASLGFTQKRKALFMPAGTIYMYYARGGDSLNISCKGKGNAVLIKAGIPYELDNIKMLAIMQTLNPQKNGEIRHPEKLCSGQTLLCKSLALKVSEWDQKNFDAKQLYIQDNIPLTQNDIIQTRRLGIPHGRDEHLPYRFISKSHLQFCTKPPAMKEAFYG